MFENHIDKYSNLEYTTFRFQCDLYNTQVLGVQPSQMYLRVVNPDPNEQSDVDLPKPYKSVMDPLSGKVLHYYGIYSINK